MKRWTVVMTLFILSAASPANAVNKLRIYSDAALTDSTLNDNAPRVANLHVVHTWSSGTTGLRFRMIPSVGFTGVWVGETSPFATLGVSTTDLSVAYGVCLGTPVMVLTVSYQFFGTSTGCSGLNFAPPLGFPFVFATGGGGCISDIPVLDLRGLQVNCPTATEATTWGRVKALYRD